VALTDVGAWDGDRLSLPFGECPRRIVLRVSFPPPDSPVTARWTHLQAGFRISGADAEGRIVSNTEARRLERVLCTARAEAGSAEVLWRIHQRSKAVYRYATPRAETMVVVTVDPVRNTVKLTANDAPIAKVRLSQLASRHLRVRSLRDECTVELVD
jgi:hypothetical protein